MKSKKSPQMIKQRKLLRKSTLIILFGVAVISGLTILVVKQSPSIKDRYQAAPPVSENLLQNLIALKLNDKREYLPLTESLASGDRIAFKVSVLRPTFVGLLVSVNQQKPRFEFYARLPPGEGRKIERQGVRYIHTVSNAVNSVKFCVVDAIDKKALQKLNTQIRTIWPHISGSSCLTLK